MKEQIYFPTPARNPYWDDDTSARLDREKRLALARTIKRNKLVMVAYGAALFTAGYSEKLDKPIGQTPSEYNARFVRKTRQAPAANVDDLL